MYTSTFPRCNFLNLVNRHCEITVHSCQLAVEDNSIHLSSIAKPQGRPTFSTLNVKTKMASQLYLGIPSDVKKSISTLLPVPDIW